ncbi:peptidase domain-containing ABC transporter [Deminuibacter soli]|uniref:Peptidase domain-containing ABC transporter n=1 Tax=Deminuibacter soli TaxID=2291815 RepID=A0A3E1NGI9_9BACT|nr:peptidase domain-containing ABC transporter [Deminuibacter soli]RFM26961.1 peptidase domain-containing ABC transporter [Deminuibacter soli]
MPFTFYKQLNAMDCGPTCLRMIARYYGKHFTSETIRKQMNFGRQGATLFDISEAAEKFCFRSRGVRVPFEKLLQLPVPAILHWNQNHFVVLISASSKRISVADPKAGLVNFTKEEFLQKWVSSKLEGVGDVGSALILEPTPAFYEQEGDKAKALNWGVISRYLHPQRWQVFQVVVTLLVASLLQLIFPFLTQTMVDTGINTRNMQYITIVLVAQLTLTLSSTFVSFIRSRLQLRIANSLNISILSDFWIKLTNLPLSYFDSRQVGDTLQRINDNKTIESFLTGQAITTLFSMLNFVVYSIVLVFYNSSLFLVFTVGNLFYFIWIQLFLRIRRKINYQTFHLSSYENTATLQLIQGMQDIKLNRAERLKRWEWENIQSKVLKLNFRNLNYSQLQSAGAVFISHGKDILISFLVARMVVEGTLTFGAMLAIQYIIGQMSSPIEQFIGLVQSVQDTKISMERLNEIHLMDSEEPAGKTFTRYLPDDKSIHIESVSFAYPGAVHQPVLDNISLTIPAGKVTAIVGVSGSGKTTLLKLLLKVYDQYQGHIDVGGNNFRYLSPSFWRSQCGSVLQDGYIFNDTIARNVALGDEFVDHLRLIKCCKIANILAFIETLPNGFDTKLGIDGTGLSQGQKQRLLIARAAYINPEYLFFDEATNSLDAENEKCIVENLSAFFEGRTVVIVAHRLSTVKNADKIVVLHRGKVVEEGNHKTLSSKRGRYYELVKNQLELGS